MNKRDIDYYRGRIAQERLAARTASTPAASQRHLELAEEYVSLIEANGESATETVR